MPYSAAHYKNKIASRYVPVDPAQIGAKIAEADYYLSSVKYDGHFAMMELRSGTCKLFSAGGNLLRLPPLENAASQLKHDLLLAGELVVFKDGKPGKNSDVSAALDDAENHDLRFAVFDLVELNGQPAASDIRERFDWVRANLNAGPVFPVEQHYFESRKDIIAFYNEKSATEEGVIVRSPNGVIYKIKPVITLDLVVLGYAGDPNSSEPRLRELLLGLVTESGDFQVVTRCGNGFSEKERTDWMDRLTELHTASDFTEVSGAKTAFIMVRPELVVEIQCLDLINGNAAGPIAKPLLRFDKQKGFHTLGNRNTVSCISPVWTRLRTDKQPGHNDAGETQAVHLLQPLPTSDLLVELPPSTVLKREVYTKSGKTGQAVRKFLALQTHKEKSGLYAPFMVMFTDFSAGRKTPLEQELHLCASREEALDMLKALKEENIKKGWEPHT